MKKPKFTEEQIASALKQAEVGTPIEEVCRKMGISDATFYNWRGPVPPWNASRVVWGCRGTAWQGGSFHRA